MRFLPREEKFYELLEGSAENLCHGARLLDEMVREEKIDQEHATAISDVEHKGDEYTQEAMRKLNLTFVTPMDREDIYGLISCLDDILDYIEACADRLVLFGVDKPTPEAKELSGIIVKGTAEICASVALLRAMRDTDQVIRRCQELDRLENEADHISRTALGRLFQGEFAPLDAIKWMDLYHHLETATDKCEDAANLLETIVLKHG
jgi:predicted phosphate transport protein (TIGR00153 family)